VTFSVFFQFSLINGGFLIIDLWAERRNYIHGRCPVGFSAVSAMWTSLNEHRHSTDRRRRWLARGSKSIRRHLYRSSSSSSSPTTAFISVKLGATWPSSRVYFLSVAFCVLFRPLDRSVQTVINNFAVSCVLPATTAFDSLKNWQ